MMSKEKASTGRDDDKLGQIIEMLNKLQEESKQRIKEIEILGRAVAESKLGIGNQETIKKATSGSCQSSLVPNSLNKSLEKKNVTVENEEMVLKEFSKELQSNVENSYEKEISIDTDSQDYIFIKTDLMFDENSLTKHQNESLKRRKEDIAALYNDLSQSSSQDTQDLQEWLDKKSKSLGETEKDHNKKDNISMRNILDDDANKVNKIEMKELQAVSKSTAENDTKSTDNVEQNISLESVQKAKDNAYSNENLLIEEDQMLTAKNACDSAEPKTSADFMSRDLNANTQEKSLENKDDKSLPPSMLDNSKRRNRYNVAVKPDTSPKFEEIVYNQTRQSNTNKTLRNALKTKLIQDKSEIINRQKASENVENKLTEERKKGVGRKSVSDSESEITNARQRREVLLTDIADDSDKCRFVESDNAVTSVVAIDEANLSQRTRNEISRLRSRRSKSCDDKRQSREGEGASIAKREAKHGGRSGRLDKVEVKKDEDTGRILQNEKSGLEEQRKVEENTKEEIAEVNSKGILNNKCDLLDTERAIKINDAVQNIKFTESRSHTQNDREDVVENSQELSNKSKLAKIRIALNKIEDTKTILQNKKNSLEGEKEIGEKKEMHRQKLLQKIYQMINVIYLKKKRRKKKLHKLH